jgi:hypothetical protein
MESTSNVTVWDPPRRFVAESRDDVGPDGPTIATEWTVEARSGGVCVVRVVHSWFASTDDWDEQYEGHSYGWLAFFRILRLYLTHFRGQRSAAFQLMGAGPEPKARAWDALIASLGLPRAAVGQKVRAPGGAQPLAGVVAWTGPDEWPDLLLKLDEPAPGIAHLFAMPMGGQVLLSMRLYLYGDGASSVAAQAAPAWQAWVQEHFPIAG